MLVEEYSGPPTTSIRTCYSSTREPGDHGHRTFLEEQKEVVIIPGMSPQAYFQGTITGLGIPTWEVLDKILPETRALNFSAI